MMAGKLKILTGREFPPTGWEQSYSKYHCLPEQRSPPPETFSCHQRQHPVLSRFTPSAYMKPLPWLFHFRSFEISSVASRSTMLIQNATNNNSNQLTLLFEYKSIKLHKSISIDWVVSQIWLFIFMLIKAAMPVCYLTAELEGISEVRTSVLQYSSAGESPHWWGQHPLQVSTVKCQRPPPVLPSWVTGALLHNWCSLALRGCSYNGLSVQRTERSMFLVFKWDYLSSSVINW